jgi:hypothetical protein
MDIFGITVKILGDILLGKKKIWVKNENHIFHSTRKYIREGKQLTISGVLRLGKTLKSMPK